MLVACSAQPPAVPPASATSQASAVAADQPHSPTTQPSVIGALGQPSSVSHHTPVSDDVLQPLRPHSTTSAGSGVFAQVAFSDGLAPYTDEDVLDRFRRVDVALSPTGDGSCWISQYDTDVVWIRFGGAGEIRFGRDIDLHSDAPGALSTEPVGVLDGPTGPHGYLVPLTFNAGEGICFRSETTAGWTLIYGPDIYYWYDSYCFRKPCQ
jgi:hypothetical protein